MPHPVNRLIALVLSMLLALAAGPVVAAHTGPAISANCDECCAYAPGGAPCATASACAPANTAQDDEAPAKPIAAWCAGILKAAYIPATATSWASVPASRALGPPSYLRFGRFLL